MKIVSYSYLILLSAFLIGCSAASEDKSGGVVPDQILNITIVKSNGSYVAVEPISGRQLEAYTSADQTLQAAINQMEQGGTIEIMGGKYELQNTVYLKSGITIKGSGRSTELIVAGTDTTGVGIIGIGLKDLMVRDLSLIAADTTSSIAGICYDHCGDCKMENLYAEGFAKYGLWLRKNSFLCHINNSTAVANNRANIFTDSLHWGRAGEYMPNLITNCVTYGGYNGIETNWSIVLNIVGCVVHQPKNYGYYIHSASNSVLISGSRTYQTRHNAVVIEKSHEINITGNIFCWSRGKGIVLKGVSWGTISGNNVIDSGSEQHGGFPGVGDANGIELTDKTECIQVTGNNIFNWGGQGIMKYAVLEDASCRYNSFTSMNLNYFEEGGVVSRGSNSLVKDIVYLKDPALRGNPKGPAPLFKPERLEAFINE